MSSILENVLASVLEKVTPSEHERKRVMSLSEALVEKVSKAAKKAEITARVRVEGSVAKDTWLRGEPEIDIFMQLPASTPKDALGTVCLDIAKEATKGSKQIERFAEHPYLEAFVRGTRVNIVPCYQARPGEWLSATDRTPFHTDFVEPRLNDKLRTEIRLLKRFMKGIGVYGAEIKVGGFSGYLCELLILQYGNFIDALKAAAAWSRQWTMDYANHYKGRDDELPKIFDEPLIMVDPVDKGRNVASAVRQERLLEFVAGSRRFLQCPSERFFYPETTRAFSAKQLAVNLGKRGTAIVFVKFGSVKTVPDILWGQLYKTRRSLRKMLIQNDFSVVNDAVWSDEKRLNVFLYEVEDRFLPLSKKHTGPPVEKRSECESFLRKYVGSGLTISGPRLEDNRWIVEMRRTHNDILKLLVEKLKDGGRQIGVADLISKALRNSMRIMINKEITKTYLSNSDFAEFLTRYLRGKPAWLNE